MGWLAAAFGTIIGGVVKWFATEGAKRVALVSAALAALGTALTTLLDVLGGYIATATTEMMPPAWAEGAFAFIPGNWSVCLGLIFGSRVARLVFDWSVKSIEISTRAA